MKDFDGKEVGEHDFVWVMAVINREVGHNPDVVEVLVPTGSGSDARTVPVHIIPRCVRLLAKFIPSENSGLNVEPVGI